MMLQCGASAAFPAYEPGIFAMALISIDRWLYYRIMRNAAAKNLLSLNVVWMLESGTELSGSAGWYVSMCEMDSLASQ